MVAILGDLAKKLLVSIVSRKRGVKKTLQLEFSENVIYVGILFV